MANTSRFPIEDVVSMSELTGFNLQEIEGGAWTNALLDSTMSQFYAGTLSAIVNPGQGTRSPREVFISTFLKGTGRDIAGFGSALAKQARDITKSVLEPVTKLLKASPLILVGGIALAIILLTRKVK